MGTEDDPREEEQQEVLSFHHLLIMEFCAGKYISTLSEVSTKPAECDKCDSFEDFIIGIYFEIENP